jgi:hypothetical protein
MKNIMTHDLLGADGVKIPEARPSLAERIPLDSIDSGMSAWVRARLTGQQAGKLEVAAFNSSI